MLGFILYSVIVFFLLTQWKRFHHGFANKLLMPGILAFKLVVALVFYYHPIGYLHDGPLFLGESRQLAALFYSEPLTYFKFLTGIGETPEMVMEYMRETIYWDKPDQIYNDSKSLVRANSLLQILSFQNDQINMLWIAVLNVFGLQGVYRAITSISTGKKTLLFLLIFLLPSTTLWGASILKETYLILGIGFLMEGFFYPSSLKIRMLKLILGSFLLILFKPYILFCVAIGLIAAVLFKLLPWPKLLLTIGIMVSIGFSGIFLSRGTGIDVTEHISRKQHDFINLSNGGIWIETDTCYIGFPMHRLESFNLKFEHENMFVQFKDTITGLVRTHGKANVTTHFEPDTNFHYVLHFLEPTGSQIDFIEINNSLPNLLASSPLALFNVMFRPLPNDPPKKVEKWYFILENWFFLLLLLVAFWRNKLTTTEEWAIVLGLLTFALTLSLLIGWTTPVLGAIIRYKLPIVFAIITMSWLLLYPVKRAKL
jgi:hypothetical protein